MRELFRPLGDEFGCSVRPDGLFIPLKVKGFPVKRGAALLDPGWGRAESGFMLLDSGVASSFLVEEVDVS